MQVKKQQLEPDMEQWPGSKLGKEYVKAVYCHSAYLTYMESTSCEIAQAEIKIAGRNINNLRYTDDTTLTAECKEELKNLLMKEESEKSGIKLNIRKTKIMASGPITSWQIDGGEWKQWQILFFGGWGSKIIAVGDCSHEIKRCLSLGRKIMTNLDKW